MKQVLQSLRDGVTEVADVPCPEVRPWHILVQSQRTLVSAGTERALVEFGKAGWIQKARKQPDKVRTVLDKVKTDGLVPTVQAVFTKLDQPLPLGYCNVGRIIDIGEAVHGFSVGDRVASNGKHAEIACVPVNLCAKVPDSVADDDAAFTVLAAVGLQGIRLAQPTLGEAVVVTGLGLIGLIVVQLLRAHGCRVLGLDYDPERLTLAQQFGAETVNLAAGEDPVAAADFFSRKRGVDAVLITASTNSSEPVRQAARMCRKRGRIVLVGTSGLELSRADFYEKELSFQVSCSYGPGRYDTSYEEKGQDYPIGFVRWTEQRNFEAVLDMMADGRLDVGPLISHRFPIDEADKAYELITCESASLGVLLDYASDNANSDSALRARSLKVTERRGVVGKCVLGFIGSGNYASSVLIPAFKRTGAQLKTVACHNGVSGVRAARKFGFEITTTDVNAVLTDAEISAAVIATRHESHARFVCDALRLGKHVFVEKPLALSFDELAEIERCHEISGKRLVLMVGFNRRFAAQIQKMKQLLAGSRQPKSFVMTVNAGAIPREHWTQDPSVGGGRIVGEACHFIDLLRFLADSPIEEHFARRMDSTTNDTATIHLSFADGSIGTIHYLANGHKSYPKERLEVFCGGGILQLNNFRKLAAFGWPGFSKMNLWRQDKGQNACAAAFVGAIQEGKPSPIPFDELIEVARATIGVRDALH